MDLNEIAIEDTCKTGAKVELYKGVVITVTHSENDKFHKEFQRLSKPYMHQLRNNSLSKEMSDKLWLNAYVGTVLLNWTGITIDGVEVPFEKQKVVEILSNTRYLKLRKDIEAIASEFETFRKDTIGAVVGE